MGSMFSKPILAMGRRRTILGCNAVITLMTIPYFFTSSIVLLAITRFIIGCCAALIVNSTSCYVGEAVPTEYQVYVGTCINTGMVTGIWITNCFNLSLPYWGEDEQAPPEASDTILWRVSYSLQLLPVAVTTVCWLCIFRTEPLKFLIAKAE